MKQQPDDLDPRLEEHLALCKRMYLRMLADGTWPWEESADSTETEDMITSQDNTQ